MTFTSELFTLMTLGSDEVTLQKYLPELAKVALVMVRVLVVIRLIITAVMLTLPRAATSRRVPVHYCYSTRKKRFLRAGAFSRGEQRVSLSFVYTVCTFSSLLQFGQVTLCRALMLVLLHYGEQTTTTVPTTVLSDSDLLNILNIPLALKVALLT